MDYPQGCRWHYRNRMDDTYRTHDGHVIYVSYRGIIDMPATVWEQPGRGEDVDSSDYYLRGQPMFETAMEDNPYSWLNDIIAVSVGKQEKLAVTYEVHQIL